jgi:hypothetical protein
MARAALRTTALASTLVAIAILAGGCGGSAATEALAPLEPPSGLKVAAWDALTLRGIALDSCSAWRLVSLASTRHDAVTSARYFGVAQRLAVRYVTVRGRYDAHRRALPPSMFLPPFGTLIALEEGTCWV